MGTSTRKPPRPQPRPCQPLTRVRYFAGQVLSAEEFTAEQNYVVEKLRRHNRTLHQPGIVAGLEVSVAATGVRVAPGFALDAAGNEVCVPVAQEAPLPSVAGEVYLVLRYKEVEAALVPVPGMPGADTPATLPSRIRESFDVGYEPSGVPHSSASSQDASPPIRLARLRRVRGRWRVDARFRRPKAR